MPYIEVDEIPEGAVAADVVTREEYDTLVTERDEFSAQRDAAIAQIEEAQKAMREAQSKYANLMLGMGKETAKNEEKKETVKGATISSLFKRKEN